MKKTFFPTALAIAFWAGPAPSSTPYTVEVECPDGSTTTGLRTGSYSTWGQRPDGKPRGSWTFPFPLDVCEDGFILYKPLDQFEPEELAQARAIVATPEYQAVFADGPNYLALYHLYTELGLPDEQRLYSLLQATWQVDADRARYEELQRRYAEAASAYIESTDPAEPAYDAVVESVVNAYRILGDFGAAAETLAKLGAARGTVTGTDRQQAAKRTNYEFLNSLLADRNRDIDPSAPDNPDRN